jgi:hypothetical protein
VVIVIVMIIKQEMWFIKEKGRKNYFVIKFLNDWICKALDKNNDDEVYMFFDN